MKTYNINKLLEQELKNDENLELTIIPQVPKGKNIKLIELTKKNVQKVETMLRYNPDYPQFIDFNNLNNYDFSGINKEKISNDKKKLEDQTFKFSSVQYIGALMNSDKDLYKYLIYAILRRINSENSTRASIVSIIKITNNICNRFKNVDKLLNALTEPYDKEYKNRKYELIKCISKEVDGRHNFSLATKFCHYMNFNIHFKSKFANMYSIYDNVVKENLHYYYNYYVLNKEDIGEKVDLNYQYDLNKIKDENDIVKIYQVYQSMIDEIINKAKISRNGFDHLVWYTSKK